MLDGLQTINWDLLQEIDAPAHHTMLLDQVMIFGAQDVILLIPLLYLLLWVIIAVATRAARAGKVAPAGVIARDRARGQQLLVMAFPAVALALVINVVVGRLAGEPRPFVTHPSLVPLVAHVADDSFPSDHATVASALVTMLVVYAVYLWRRRTSEVADPTAGARVHGALAALATLLAVLGIVCVLFIGYARVYVGVHYPGDIIGGILCGLISGLIAAWVRRLIEPLLVRIIDIAERLRLA